MRSTGSDAHLAGAVFMVRPAAFAYNAETAATNRFQRQGDTGDGAELARRACEEFDRLADSVRAKGVAVFAAEDTPTPVKPDACFPNNWVSFHDDGTVVLYPMLAPNRRVERRADLIDALIAQGRFRISRTVDLAHWERRGQFLEGTGSLVLDHGSRVAFAALSPRTATEPLAEFSELLGYRTVAFESFDAHGALVYHTNVMLGLGPEFAIVCLDSIRDVAQREAVVDSLGAIGRQILPIDLNQMAGFAGNALALRSHSGVPIVVLSATARHSLRKDQVSFLERRAELVVVEVPTIEHCGGGSVRCMLAEVFLPSE